MLTAGAVVSLIICMFGLANFHDNWPKCGWRGATPSILAFVFFVLFFGARTWLYGVL